MLEGSATVGLALDFFAGIGLAKLGLEQAGWKVIFSNDISKKKYLMYEGNWGYDPHYVVSDIFALRPEDVPAAELAWASFPCIDLSLAGNREGINGRFSGAFWGFHRLLFLKEPAKRPNLVVLENVLGFLTSNNGRDLGTAIEALNDLGYVCDVLIVDAAKFVPQSRPRLFIIGVRPPYRLGIPTYTESELRPKKVVTFMKASSHLMFGDAPLGFLPRRLESFDDVAEWFPDDADIWWNREATDRLLKQMSPRHVELVKKYENLPRLRFGTVYRRIRKSGYMAEVRLDGVAGCLRTPVGGSSKQFVLQIGKGQVKARNMTAIEYARLQGAPHFRITVPTNEALHGFGDGVCVPVVEWLARECLRRIRDESLVLTHA